MPKEEVAELAAILLPARNFLWSGRNRASIYRPTLNNNWAGQDWGKLYPATNRDRVTAHHHLEAAWA